jgi:exonuclease III
MQYNNKKNSFRLGCRPAKQDPRHPPRNRDGSDKLATGTNINRQNACLLDRKEDIHIGTWNVRTIKEDGALEIVIDQLEQYRWEIVGLCETHQTEKGEYYHGSYRILTSGREDGIHREGVALILTKKASSALLSFEPISPRMLKARFRTRFGALVIIQVYAPTAAAKEEVIDQFYADLQRTVDNTARQDVLIVMGDLNAKVGIDASAWNGVIGQHGIGEENERGERLLNFCSCNNLVIANTLFKQTKPQRKWTWTSPDGHTKNLIDFIMISKRWKSDVQSCRSFAADVGSDHKLVLAKLRLRLKAGTKKQELKRYNIDMLKDESIRQEFEQSIQKTTAWQEGSNVEQMWNTIKDGIHTTAQQVLGQDRLKKKTKWITDEVLKLCHQRKELRAKLEGGQHDNSRKEYNWLTREIKRTVKRDREKWLSDQCEEAKRCSERNQTRGLYQKIKDIAGEVELKISTVKDKNGVTIEDDEKKKARWKEYFTELYNVQSPVDRSVLDELTATNTMEDEMHDFLIQEVRSAVTTLKARKAPGIDGISAELLQAGGETLVTALHELFQKIHQEEEVPNDWGKAIITPIFKKGDKSDCKNYRGISLLSVPGKVFTKVLQRRMKSCVERALAEEQAGFRPGRGTTDQIFTIRQITEKYLEHNKPCYFNFIDFKQAFDSIWQEGLWQCMRMHGVQEKLIRLIKSLYDKSEAAVRQDRQLTDWFRTTVGVRQGCTLSPDLFNLVLETVMRMALERQEAGLDLCGRLVNNLRFADDINLMSETTNGLQELTDQVSRQGERLGLVINSDKTKVMTISKEPQDLGLQITVKGNKLEQVKEFVYLGGQISQDGRCESDIKRRIGLTWAVFNKLSNIWNCHNLTLKIKMQVFEAMVVPVLMHGSECWTMREEEERRILVAEMCWLRRILGTSRLQHIRNDDIRLRTGMQVSTVDRIKARRLRWFGHVSRMDTDRIPYLALHTSVDGVRSRGRPRARWRDGVMKDIKERGLEFSEAASLVKDRDGWRTFVRPYRRGDADGRD